jgi:hypothetical protein
LPCPCLLVLLKHLDSGIHFFNCRCGSPPSGSRLKKRASDFGSLQCHGFAPVLCAMRFNMRMILETNTK